MSVQLTLKASTDRPYVSHSPDQRRVLGLVGLGTTGITDQPAGFELVLVMDCSGSMSEADQSGRQKFAEAKKGMWAIVDRLDRQAKTEDILSVIGFDSRTEVILDHLRGSQKQQLDRGQVEKILSLDRFGGMTNIHAALSLARQKLLSTSSTFVRRIILLSDGEITEGPDEAACYQLVNQIGNDGIVLDALGYGYSRLRMDFLSNLVRPTGGDREHITGSPDGILGSIFDRAKRAVATDVVLTVEFPSHILASEFYRCEPSVMYMGKPPISATHRTIQFRAGQIEMGRDYAWLFELEVPPQMPAGLIQLANVKLQYRLPDQSIQQTSAPLTVTMTENTQLAMQVDPRYTKLHGEIGLNKYEVALGQAQTLGDRQSIERTLHDMITYCDRMGLLGRANLYRQQLNHSRTGGDINKLAIEISKSTTRSDISAANLQNASTSKKVVPLVKHFVKGPRQR